MKEDYVKSNNKNINTADEVQNHINEIARLVYENKLDRFNVACDVMYAIDRYEMKLFREGKK